MKTLIVIGGATASGKTNIAIDIAKHFNTKILSADSRQCYRELNTGVAKPSASQLQEVEHFFINSHSIHDDVSAGTYEKYGLQTLADIFSHHDFAVCVGGTGLYIKALCEGLDEMPPVSPEIDAEVNEQYKMKGLQWLQQQLSIHDQAYCETGELQNPNRLIRALVFKLSTGRSILTFRKKALRPRDFHIRYFALDVAREKLYERINERVDEMMAQGLLQEAEGLLSYQNLKPLQTVGYTELFDHFAGKISLQTAIEKIKQHSRNYAKRQVTWFKNQSGFTFTVPSYENIIQALNT